MTMTDASAPRGLKGVIVADTELGDVRGPRRLLPLPAVLGPRARREAHVRGRLVPAVRGRAPERRRPRRLHRSHRGRAAPAARAGRAAAGDRGRAPAPARGVAHRAVAARGGRGDAAHVRRRSRDHPRQRAPPRCRDPGAHRRTAPRVGSDSRSSRHATSCGHAANYLWMIDGEVPDPRRRARSSSTRSSASTTGSTRRRSPPRVVTSTGADVGAAVVAALGGAVGPAARRRAEPRARHARRHRHARPHRGVGARRGGRRRSHHGLRACGLQDRRTTLGHVPRHRAGRSAATACEFAVQVEETVQRRAGRAQARPRALHQRRVLRRRGDGAVRHPRELFTSTFAASRVVGWCANVLEQSTETAIIRPSARYVGPEPPAWCPTPRN